MKTELSKPVIRGVKLSLLSYAIISILYTALQLYNAQNLSSPTFNSKRSFAKPLDDTAGYTQQQQQEIFDTSRYQEVIENNNNDEALINGYADDIFDVDDTEALYNFDEIMLDTLKQVLDKEVDLYTVNVQVLNDPVVKSKIFSGSMGSSNIKPFYFKADKEFEPEDISVATIVTNDRIHVLSRLATRYKGPISAAIHVNQEKKEETLGQLYQTFTDNPDMKHYVDVHLITDSFDRQFNMWRNIAKLYARTDYVMMLDIDFYLCTDFRSYVRNSTILMDMLRAGDSALVVPAFEYIDQSDGRHWKEFPDSKQELVELVEHEKIDMFHRSWKKGHSATDYKRWFEAKNPYQVEEYNFSYEPYVIFKKQGSPWCDERFIGYGANKAACLYEIYLSGISYYVLPNDFIIHQSHPYPESTRRKERLFNKKVYSNFREELCLRYARQFIASGLWNTSVADNLKSECRKVRGFQSTIKSIDE